MKNLTRLAMVVIVVASACSSQKYNWTHPEKDAEQYEVDNSYCRAQARGTKAIATMPENRGGQAGSFSSGWSTVPSVKTLEMSGNIYRQCMSDKGWHLEAE